MGCRTSGRNGDKGERIRLEERGKDNGGEETQETQDKKEET